MHQRIQMFYQLLLLLSGFVEIFVYIKASATVLEDYDPHETSHVVQTQAEHSHLGPAL